MRLVLTKETITATVDALRTLTDREEGQEFHRWLEQEFELKPLGQRQDIIDHLLGSACDG